jgi:putative endonuclease
MENMSTKDLFHIGEELAAKYLTGKGYNILCKNFRIKGGEIDIIAIDGETLVFVEVKTRSWHSMRSALDNITYTKQVLITRTATEYINRNPEISKLGTRFDVLILFYSRETNSFGIKHFENAFLPVFPSEL